MRLFYILILSLLLGTHGRAAESSTNYLGLETNAHAVLKVFAIESRYLTTNVHRILRTNDGLRVETRFRLHTNSYWYTNKTFERIAPGTFSHQVWTNVLARTNGRTTRIWSEQRHPSDWPKHGPIVKWNPDSLIYGMDGFTAVSPCWEGEGSHGQVRVTALTRRHGYTRGHGMGPSGFGQRLAGKKIWFLTARNRLIEVKVIREVVRTRSPDNRDYTILLFDRDLPESIQPMRVVDPLELLRVYPSSPMAPRPVFLVEQGGHVSAELPGFTVPTWKGGDSGSPNLFPLGNELVFFSGRSTSGPGPEMQEDMDALSRQARLDPDRYRLKWIDLPKER